jgi:hypothetical protein
VTNGLKVQSVILVPRAAFVRIAGDMLAVVESVAQVVK